MSGLADFERQLADVQSTFFAYKASRATGPIADSVLYLETEPVTAPLPGGPEPIACEDFLRIAHEATRRWARVVERVEIIRGEIRDIRGNRDGRASAEALVRIRAHVDAANRDVDAVREAYPTELYSAPDRLIRYVWRLAPRSILDEWGEGSTLLADSFSPNFLAMPGYTWAGQGRLSELSTIAGTPSSTGRSITLERVATPAQACAGKDAVWMSGIAMIRFKRAAASPQGCSGEGCLGRGPAGMIQSWEGIRVVLRGETQPPDLDVSLPRPPSPPCQKHEGREEKPPPTCPH